MQTGVIQKLSWRLSELPSATGFSLAFWRKVVLERKIDVQEVEGGIVIMDGVLREFLTRRTRKALDQAATVEVAGATS